MNQCVRAFVCSPLRGFARCGGLIALCALVVGCGESGLVTHPVSGRVIQNGKPVAEALVVFHPVGPAPEWSHQPLAHTDAQGRFQMTTDQDGDGAPAGDYVATVELRALKLVGEEQVRDGRDLLPKRYKHPKTSPLKVTVAPGANELPDFVITTAR